MSSRLKDGIQSKIASVNLIYSKVSISFYSTGLDKVPKYARNNNIKEEMLFLSKM